MHQTILNKNIRKILFMWKLKRAKDVRCKYQKRCNSNAVIQIPSEKLEFILFSESRSAVTKIECSHEF